MLINELSKVTGLTVHTLRYYENLGLIEGQKMKPLKAIITKIMTTKWWRK